MAPAEAELTDNALVWRTDNLAVRMEPLSADAFLTWLKGRGAAPEVLAHPNLEAYLASLAVFRISLYNHGEESLVFNPEQVILRNKAGVVGFMVDSSDLLRTQHGHSDPRLEQLAALFVQERLELKPGMKVGRVVAFRPTGQRFPRKIQLCLNRLYYGIAPADVVCLFQVRYPGS